MAPRGACVVVRYPADPTVAARTGPVILALAPGPQEPLAVGPIDDVVLGGDPTPDALVAAVVGT